MAFIYAVIKGERNLLDYCARRWKNKRIYWTGCFGHIDDCTVELIDAFGPDGTCDRYYILYMDHPRGEECDQSVVRRRVYQEIRQGTIKLLNV
ncbi:MAG: hypothetical protein IJ551_09800 [Prevotella sp.]|nr:hypothetical protein [Prevotella sp.]